MRCLPHVVALLLGLLFLGGCASGRPYSLPVQWQVEASDAIPWIRVAADPGFDDPWDGTPAEYDWVSSDGLPLDTTNKYVFIGLGESDSPQGSDLMKIQLRDGEQLRLLEDGPSGVVQTWTFERSFGRFEFTAVPLESGAVTRRLRVHVDREELDALSVAGWTPTVRDCVLLITSDTSTSELLPYWESDPSLSLQYAITLARHGVASSTFHRFVESELGYDEEDVTRLLLGGANLEAALEWDESGRTLTVDDLLYAYRRGIEPEFAKLWDAVGSQFATSQLTVQQLQFVRNRSLGAEEFARWHRAGRPVTLDQLYWVKVRGVSSRNYVAWSNAGYDLTLDQLYWVQRRGITADQGATWTKVDRRLTLDELYWVQRRGIRSAHHHDWSNAGYELTLDQIYWVQRRGVTPAQATAWIEVDRRLTLDNLYWVLRRGLRPAYSESWAKAGYEFSLDNLYSANRHGLDPVTAGAWRELGYRCTIDQLVDLKNWGVTPRYARGFVHSDSERPTPSELIEYRRSNRRAEPITQ